MLQKIRLAFLGVMIIFLSGCATIVSGSNQTVSIASNPAGVEIQIDGVSQGITPRSFELERGKTHQIILSSPGYLSETRVLKKGLNKWFWAGLLIPYSPLVDWLTGSIYSVKPDKVNVQLTKL